MNARHITLGICLLACAVTAGCARLGAARTPGSLVLAEGGQSDFQIVVSREASPSTRYGAQELQGFL